MLPNDGSDGGIPSATLIYQSRVCDVCVWCVVCCVVFGVVFGVWFFLRSGGWFFPPFWSCFLRFPRFLVVLCVFPFKINLLSLIPFKGLSSDVLVTRFRLYGMMVRFLSAINITGPLCIKREL